MTEGVARLVARCQRRPWRACLVLAPLAFLLPWALEATIVLGLPPMIAGHAAGAVLLALWVHVASGVRSWLDRWGPVAVGVGFFLAWSAWEDASFSGYIVESVAGEVSEVALGRSWHGMRLAMTAAVVAFALGVPSFPGHLAFRSVAPWSALVGCAPIALGVVFLPFPDALPRELAELFSVLRVLVPFELLVRTSVGRVSAAALGFVFGSGAAVRWFVSVDRVRARMTFRGSVDPGIFRMSGPPVDPAWIYGAAGAAVAALGLVGRQARSMTAVPQDHPVIRDFGPLRRTAR